MSPPKKEGSDAATPHAARHTKSEEWERKKHQDHLRAINALTIQLSTNQARQDASDRSHSFREKLTIWLVALTLIATAGADVIFYFTMRDAKFAAEAAQHDNRLALDAAGTRAWDALMAAHIDSGVSLEHADAATAKALLAAQAANGISQSTAKQQLRAYVGTRFLNVVMDSNGMPAMVRISIVNDGQTPAYDTLTQSGSGRSLRSDFNNLTLSSDPLSDNKAGRRRSVTIIPPHSNEVQNIPLYHVLDEQDLVVLKSDIGGPFVYGTTYYSDIFGKRHSTDFCYFLVSDQSLPTGLAVNGSPCPRHNTAD